MNFKNKFHIYNKNAVVQKKVAFNLNNFINSNADSKINSAFEIGCGTGIFTRYFICSHRNTSLILNDFFNTEDYIKDIKYTDFIEGDIEEINIPKSDIIVSSSVLQWIKNFEKLIKKIVNSCKIFSFSIYIKGNLIEINRHFNISLDYMEFDKIYAILKKYFKCVRCKKESIKKSFSSPLEALRSLKNTGVTGFKRTDIKTIRSFKNTSLTYEVGYFYCSQL